MNFLEEIERRHNEIKETQLLAVAMQKNLVEWCRLNRHEIKATLFPEKNKIYRLINAREAFCSLHAGWGYEDEFYYFKPTDLRFRPHLDLSSHKSIPTVTGSVLDCNYRVLDANARVQVTNLEKIDLGSSPDELSNTPTQVYVMIDKNTGYYKIGRSKNPTIREKTLQSEKPTIEMIFCFTAKVSDEKELHKKFDSKRVRGEWFDLSGSDIQEIKEHFAARTA